MTKVENVYIVYDLDAWPTNPENNSKFKDCSKYVYNGYKIIFQSAGSSFNNFARNIIIFGVDNKSSFHSNSRKNNLLILGEGPASGINEGFGSSEKN